MSARSGWEARTFLLGLALVLLVGGCMDDEAIRQSDAHLLSHSVVEFETPSGIPCVGIWRGHGAGLSCDWDRRPQEEPDLPMPDISEEECIGFPPNWNERGFYVGAERICPMSREASR